MKCSKIENLDVKCKKKRTGWREEREEEEEETRREVNKYSPGGAGSAEQGRCRVGWFLCLAG